ncbi:2-succinyl-6-hydroxy-2,4-cyclohexadiene-1-carboxylate synthase [Bacillaceae bacterium SIJ1]|uniref:2-succinyl-6-hydroxy-2, 4-cyclohexadiene-1-carboxylate synthase n=1 Tax=Litoribacterium kuwaitense TaxID=1398745 RepID=UPI0013EAA509|nr:2-succinyl-6-hydroxy-2,4-cyclohexadiene-1-carboxylate synthase [Litoribacterium kuwaitense]NGP44238.1 2-succinyl-6-hydroxy-2,4-cyclohexadiene-1-carboxylate synthase [Litoribacterium kuwaitense]
MYFQARGVPYHYRDAGPKEAPALLLLHGFTASIETWEPFIPLWSQQHRVISVDLPGHGKTPSPAEEGRFKMQEVVHDLCLLLDHLNIEKTSILGYSMGGRVAISFAVHASERVERLIVENASPGLKTEEERRQRRERDEQLAHRITTFGMASFVAYWRELDLFASQKALPMSVRETLDQERLQNSPSGLASSLRGMGTGAQPSYWDALPTLSVQLTFIAGTLDQKFLDIGQDICERVPNNTMLVAENAGHAVHIESPVWFATTVLNALNDQKEEQTDELGNGKRVR